MKKTRRGKCRVRNSQPEKIIMSNDQQETAPEVVPAPVPAPAPTSDTQNRLSAAREFACEQYEKLRRATADQVENVRQYTKEARRQLNEGWDATRAKAKEGWDVTRSKAKDLHKVSEEYVKENPTASVLGAIGVGVLLGLLLGSGRR